VTPTWRPPFLPPFYLLPVGAGLGQRDRHGAADALRASGNDGGPADQIKQVRHGSRGLAPWSGMAGSQITNRLLHGSQRDDHAVTMLARLGHRENTMGAYIATAGIAGRVGGSSTLRGLRRTGI
jgi:hypothetical protein